MLFISYLLKRNLVHSIWFCCCWKIFFGLLWFLSPTFRFTIFDLFTDGAASAWPTCALSSTQTSTHSVIRKIVDFICTSLFVTDTVTTTGEKQRWAGEQETPNKQRLCAFANIIPATPLTVFRHLFLFCFCSPLFTAGFPVLALCLRRARGNRKKGKGQDKLF